MAAPAAKSDGEGRKGASQASMSIISLSDCGSSSNDKSSVSSLLPPSGIALWGASSTMCALTSLD
jgi:hypothetical protein